jgi:sec-independent protein translocase protein TatB
VFGINGGEALVLLLVAVIVVGPERLPHYAEQLGGWVRQLRAFMLEAKARVDEELGVDTTDVDWQALDPRRYDPRRIVREALLDDILPAAGAARSAPVGRTYTTQPGALPGVPEAAEPATSPTDGDGAAREPAAPYDDEAT